MNEFNTYIRLIKIIIDNNEEKETVFYNDGEWYSRSHSRNITLEELENWLKEINNYHWNNQEELYFLREFIDEKTLEAFDKKYCDKNGNFSSKIK